MEIAGQMALKLKKTAYHDTYFIVNSILGTQKSWRNGYRVLCVKLPACASDLRLDGPPDYFVRRTTRSAGPDDGLCYSEYNRFWTGLTVSVCYS